MSCDNCGYIRQPYEDPAIIEEAPCCGYSLCDICVQDHLGRDITKCCGECVSCKKDTLVCGNCSKAWCKQACCGEKCNDGSCDNCKKVTEGTHSGWIIHCDICEESTCAECGSECMNGCVEEEEEDEDSREDK